MILISGDTYKKIGEFSLTAFPDAGTDEHLIKLKEEILEFSENKEDVSEAADCFIALMAACYKAGITCMEISTAIIDKFEVLKTRTWIKNEDGTYYHKNSQ